MDVFLLEDGSRSEVAVCGEEGILDSQRYKWQNVTDFLYLRNKIPLFANLDIIQLVRYSLKTIMIDMYLNGQVLCNRVERQK